MQRIPAIAGCAFLLAITSAWAVGKDKAQYVGGSLDVPESSQGKLDTQKDATALLFVYEWTTPGDGAWSRQPSVQKHSGEVRVPYSGVATIEYGQQVGRRVGAAILVSPAFLFSKGRKHFLTLTYKDAAGVDQVVILQLGKDVVRTTLAILKARTGKEIQFQDEEARKQMGGGR